MNTNNDDLEKKDIEGNPQGEESPAEDIPLWLQGLEERESDETKPISPESEQPASWIREVDESGVEQESREGEEAFGSDNFQPLEIQGGPKTEEQQEEFPIESALEPESFEETVDQEKEDEPVVPIDTQIVDSESPEGFVDISELDISEPVDQDEVFLDDEPLREGELPEWLLEMIAETEDEEVDKAETEFEEEPSFEDNQPEPFPEPISIESETSLATEELEDEPSPVEDVSMKAADELEPTPAFPMLEEDAYPVDFIPAEEENLPAAEEEPEFESQLPSEEEEEENLFDRAKLLLDQGNFIDAVSVIKTLIEDADNLDELEAYLNNFAGGESKPNTNLMEVIGDLAMKQGKPSQAFKAYTKAIQLLLVNDEVHGGMG